MDKNLDKTQKIWLLLDWRQYMLYSKHQLGHTRWGSVAVDGYPAEIFFFSTEFALILRTRLDPNNPPSDEEEQRIIIDLALAGFPRQMTPADGRMLKLLKEGPYSAPGRVRLRHEEPHYFLAAAA